MAETFPGPKASTAIQAVTAESIPPDSPRWTLEKPQRPAYSESPKARACAISFHLFSAGKDGVTVSAKGSTRTRSSRKPAA